MTYEAYMCFRYVTRPDWQIGVHPTQVIRRISDMTSRFDQRVAIESPEQKIDSSSNCYVKAERSTTTTELQHPHSGDAIEVVVDGFALGAVPIGWFTHCGLLGGAAVGALRRSVPP